MKTFYLAVSSIVMAYVFVLLAGASAWGYFSDGRDHYIAVALALPFRLSAMIAPDRWQTWLAFAIYCLVSLGIIVGLKRIARRFSPGPKTSGPVGRM
jgi:hypothetical protein